MNQTFSPPRSYRRELASTARLFVFSRSLTLLIVAKLNFQWLLSKNVLKVLFFSNFEHLFHIQGVVRKSWHQQQSSSRALTLQTVTKQIFQWLLRFEQKCAKIAFLQLLDIFSPPWEYREWVDMFSKVICIFKAYNFTHNNEAKFLAIYELWLKNLKNRECKAYLNGLKAVPAWPILLIFELNLSFVILHKLQKFQLDPSSSSWVIRFTTDNGHITH